MGNHITEHIGGIKETLPLSLMRKCTTLLALLIACLFAKAQSIIPQVNENVELMSILSRMAGFPEYNMDMAGQYIKDMDNYFKDNTEHQAVHYMKELRNKYGISYDAVMSMAVHLDNRNGTLSLIEEDIPTLEKRWKNVDKDEFLSYLNNFYKDTKFNEFFRSHKDLYGKGLKSYQDNVINHFDIDWYSDFYGNEPQETFSVIIGFCNGGGNYGVNRQITGKMKEVFAIVGYYVDKKETPMYSKEYLPTLIHEFNHSFINHYLDENKYPIYVKQLEPAATNLFISSHWSMSKQAYGNWKTMINESLVRAAVICYMLDNEYEPEEIRNVLLEQVQRNFRWMPELVSLLRKYEKKQSKYGNFEKFYPNIIKFFKEYSQKENERFDIK
ncbi:DUF4932 domain-containing protein [Prevotella sp. HCN-7019]|uniref:DUF4932 domain-containing protein n=1 Tax=Prevotella sp. HCN-7019 TaxID=3134668 RepID=UPI0030BA5CEF